MEILGKMARVILAPMIPTATACAHRLLRSAMLNMVAASTSCLGT
jgi:hypothetical protein